MDDKTALRELQTLPGVGPSIGRDLLELGIRSRNDLRETDPFELYERHCAQKGCQVDRCVLYVFRCAVYAASTEEPEPELCKWWNWKDKP